MSFRDVLYTVKVLTAKVRNMLGKKIAEKYGMSRTQVCMWFTIFKNVHEQLISTKGSSEVSNRVELANKIP